MSTGTNPELDRYTWIARDFGARVDAVPADRWDAPSPVKEWRARDVVGHLAEWIPSFFCDRWQLEAPLAPSIEDDPAGAWHALDEWIASKLTDETLAGEVRETPMGERAFAPVFDLIATSDIFLHTWDLARATGLDERLDPDEVHRMYVEMEPLDDVLRQSGQYGPRVEVPVDADEQTKLIAFIGRQP